MGLGLCLVACADRGEAGPEAGTSSVPFDAVFEVYDSISLEESPAVVNVGIEVVPDPHGGFLVADEAEAQVRRYSRRGELLWHAGRRGLGPGEFQAAVGGARLPSGHIVAADRNGRLTYFDESSGDVVRTQSTGILHGSGIWVIDSDELLIAGHDPGGPMGPRLHVWSIDREEIESSFFSPLGNSPNPEISIVAGWSGAAIRGDTVVAFFATMDTLFFFSREGSPLRRLPFPSSGFRVVQEEADPRRLANPRERAELLARFDYVSHVEVTPDGTLLVEYQSIVPDEAMARRRHLLGLSPDGSRLFEVRNGPRLLARTDDGQAFVFQRPGIGLPSDWIAARLKR